MSQAAYRFTRDKEIKQFKKKGRPITYDILCQLNYVMKRGMFGKFVDTMLMSACSLPFFAFPRCGELAIQNGNQDRMLFVTDIMMDDSMKAFTLG